MGKSPKRTTGSACGNCPHHHCVETTLHSRYQNSCATPEGNHQQRKLLRGLTPTTETAGSCGAPGHREASVPGGGCPFPGREPVPGAWKRPTQALGLGLVTIKSYGTRNCNFKCNLRRQRGNAFPNHQHLKQMTPEHCKELAARWGRSPPPIHMRHLKTKPAKESIIRSQGGAQFLAWDES